EKPPKESDVYSGLLELATYTKFETNIIHRDVIDAMIRQPFSNQAKPFRKNNIQPGAVLQAVDYDLGKNGVAYSDNDTSNEGSAERARNVGNRGRVYRNDGVDIRKDSARYESYYVSDIEKGEWLQYSINVLKKGQYTIQLLVAADKEGGSLSVKLGQNFIANDVKVPNTEGLKKWQMVEIKNVNLPAGKQVLRVYIGEGGFNLKSIGFGLK
ncbi:MAG TPA: carbohydrate-binding protein, partial [Chitinophagaceae bacterium]|nr:carbohydrate-binding protein [Chitinophagaceae bacterium]